MAMHVELPNMIRLGLCCRNRVNILVLKLDDDHHHSYA